MSEKLEGQEVSLKKKITFPDDMNISLASLEAFVVVAVHTSIAEAARSCGVKEDTFRKRLDALESWAAVVLMQRKPDLILTPDGQRLLPIAQRACKAIKEFQKVRSTEQARSVVTGKLYRPESGSLRYRHVASRTYVEID